MSGLEDAILKNEKGSEIHIENPLNEFPLHDLQDTEKSQSLTNRMAINIDYKTNSLNQQINQEKKLIQNQQNKIEQLLLEKKKKKEDDPEQIILMKILEKMLNKYKIIQPINKNQEYSKYKPRQWETIEDKLKTLDINAEFQKMKNQGEPFLKYKKDFVKQIQTHVEEIIRTGKKVEMNTQSAFLNKQKKELSRQADIGIKIQQLRTTVTNLNLVTSESHLSSDFINKKKQYIQNKLSKNSPFNQSNFQFNTNQINQTSEIQIRSNTNKQINQKQLNKMQYSFEDLRSHSDFNYNQGDYESQKTSFRNKQRRQFAQSPQIQIDKVEQEKVIKEKQKKNRHSRSFAPLAILIAQQNNDDNQENNQHQQIMNAKNIEFQTNYDNHERQQNNQIFKKKTENVLTYDQYDLNDSQIQIFKQNFDSTQSFIDENIEIDDQIFLPQKKIKQISQSLENKLNQGSSTRSKKGKKQKNKKMKINMKEQLSSDYDQIEKKEILLENESDIVQSKKQSKKKLKPLFNNDFQNQNIPSGFLDFQKMNSQQIRNIQQQETDDQNQNETALNSTRDFFSQYNRLEDVLKFKMPVVSRKLMENSGRAFNSRLEQIYQKLRDPNGNQTQILRHQIIKNRIKLDEEPQSKIQLQSSNQLMSQSLINQLGIQDQQKGHQRNQTQIFQNKKYFTAHQSMMQSQLQFSNDDNQKSQNNKLKPLFKTIIPQSEQKLPILRAISVSNDQSSINNKHFQQIENSLSKVMQTQIHFKQQYNHLKERQQRDYLHDLSAQDFQMKLQIQSELRNPYSNLKKPKQKDWMSKEVLLPILGKNKTTILHSSDQLQKDSILLQKQCLNKLIQ